MTARVRTSTSPFSQSARMLCRVIGTATPHRILGLVASVAR